MQRIVKSAFQRLLRHGDSVGGNGDVAYNALPFLLQDPVIDPVLLIGSVNLGGAVKLVNINIIGFEHFKALLQPLLHQLRCGGSRLGGDDDVFSDIAQCPAELVLAVGVGIGGIVEIDSCLISGAENSGGLLLRNPLNGQRAEGRAADGKTGSTETGVLHGKPPFDPYGNDGELFWVILRERDNTFLPEQ